MKVLFRLLSLFVALSVSSLAQCTDQGGNTADAGGDCMVITAYAGCMDGNFIDLCSLTVIACETGSGMTMQVVDYGCSCCLG